MAYTPTPTGSEDDGEDLDPRHRSQASPTPSRRSPRRGEGRDKSRDSAVSPPIGRGGGRRGRVHRLLTYGDGGTPQGTLQAVGALLRHPPSSRSQRPRSSDGWMMWPTWSPPDKQGFLCGGCGAVHRVPRPPSLRRLDGELVERGPVLTAHRHILRRRPREAVVVTIVSTGSRMLESTSSAGGTSVVPPVRG